jgi:drug/metabolite transporter (DMT)-like permease
MITEQSIGKLFLAGLIPGLIIAFFFVVIIYGWCKIDPTLGPRGEKSTWKERIATLPEIFWVVLIFVLVVGGLMKGFFTYFTRTNTPRLLRSHRHNLSRGDYTPAALQSPPIFLKRGINEFITRCSVV